MNEDAREVRREAEFAASPAELWEALTDERLLSEWLGDEVELVPEEGGTVRVCDGDAEREGVVTRVEEERLLAFTWERDGAGRSEVEFLVDAVAGGSRIVVIERAPAVSAAVARAAWGARLSSLAMALALVAA